MRIIGNSGGCTGIVLRIEVEKRILLRARQERVCAPSATRRGSSANWFGVEFEKRLCSRRADGGPNQADQSRFRQESRRCKRSTPAMPMRSSRERVEPISRFAFRWHPFAIYRRSTIRRADTLVTFDPNLPTAIACLQSSRPGSFDFARAPRGCVRSERRRLGHDGVVLEEVLAPSRTLGLARACGARPRIAVENRRELCKGGPLSITRLARRRERFRARPQQALYALRDAARSAANAAAANTSGAWSRNGSRRCGAIWRRSRTSGTTP